MFAFSSIPPVYEHKKYRAAADTLCIPFGLCGEKRQAPEKSATDFVVKV